MRKYQWTSLLDLPIRPWDRDDTGGTSIVQDTYVRERKALKHAHQLRPFVRRWQAVWLLRPGTLLFRAARGSWYHQASGELLWGERALLDGRFDAKRVMARMLQQPAEEPIPFNPNERDWQLVGHLSIPGPFLTAYSLAQHYDVGHDLAMVRLFLDSYPEFNNRLRRNEEVPPYEEEAEYA